MSPVNHDFIVRVACYVRVSHQEQKLRGLSPDAQREALARYAKEHNLKIVEWYEDLGVSGRKIIRKRPELQRMIKDAEEGKFDRIIFIKLDRYFRSVAEYYECQKRLEAKNVLWTATEEKYDLTTASGRYWVTQKLAMAEYEADQTGERIDLVNEYKVKTGQPLTGSLGIAYTAERDEETGFKKVVKDKKNEPLVIDFIDYFLTYNNKRKAHALIRGKYGNDVPSYKAFTRLLKDTKIYGFYRGNPNYCSPYIDEEAFNKIQDILKNNIKETPTKRIYLFSGLIRCPKCDRLMTGRHTSKSINYINNKRYEYDKDYYHYRCNHHHNDNFCEFNKLFNETTLEKQLLNKFDKFVNVYIDEANVTDARDKEEASVKDKIKQIKGEMTRLNNMYQKGRKSEDEYDKEYEDLENQLQALNSRLEPVLERDLSIYQELLKSDWKGLYEALNKENKRAFWRKYIKQLIIDTNGTIQRVIFF